MKALGEIRKIYTLSHRSVFERSSKFRQIFLQFCSLNFFADFLQLFIVGVRNSPIVMNLFQNLFWHFYKIDQHRLDSPISWHFAMNSCEFKKMFFETLRKRYKKSIRTWNLKKTYRKEIKNMYKICEAFCSIIPLPYLLES